MSITLIKVKRANGNVYCVEPGLECHPGTTTRIWVSENDGWAKRLATKLITIFAIVPPIEFAFTDD